MSRLRRAILLAVCAVWAAGCVKDDGLAMIAQVQERGYVVGGDGIEVPEDDDGEEGEAENGEADLAAEAAPIEIPRPPEPSLAEADIRARAEAAYQEVLRGTHGVRWQTRTTFPVPGGFTLEILHLIRTDPNGDRIRTLRAAHRRAPTVRTATPPAMTEEEARALGERIADLVHAYTYAPGSLYQRLIREGRFDGARLPIRAEFSTEDFLMSGDSLVLSCKPVSGEIERIAFTADLDGRRLEGVTTYRNLPNGAAYPHRTDVTVAGTHIKATVECFGHQPEYR